MIDNIINGIFFIDMLVIFRTTYYNKRGEEVFSGKQIATNYLKGQFYPDLIACIPFTAILNLSSDITKVTGLTKLWRITKIN